MTTSNFKYMLMGVFAGSLLIAAGFIYVAMKNQFIRIQLEYQQQGIVSTIQN